MDDENDNLFNLTRKLATIQISRLPTSELIMDNQKLNLSDVPMIKAMITPEIKKIELMENKLIGPDIREICTHLERYSLSVLTTLNLAENNIGDEGAKAISYYLVEPPCKLLTLTVSYNNITDKGGVQLAQSLAENKSLELLNMDCNQLTDVTLAEIERSITANPKIPLFNLSLAEFDEKPLFTKTGAKLLWKLMCHYPQLTITGDPPFSLGSIYITENTKQKTKFLAKEKILSRNEDLNLFECIAVESINRMRQKSQPLIFQDDQERF